MEFLDSIAAFLFSSVDFVLHIDVHLNQMANTMGVWLYAVLFLIVFCETGLVVTPILPGDSLLFAVGTLAAIDGSPLNVIYLGIALSLAGVLGDTTNYYIGNFVGPRVFKMEKSRFFNPKHLHKTQNFFKKYGGKTIVIARFVPIVRTFAPFVAGVGNMGYRRFIGFSLVGGLSWVWIFLLSGYWLGNIPVIKRNFHIAIVVVILISLAPALIEYLRERRAHKKAIA